MIAELGHYALVLALGLALVQGSMPLVGARGNDPALMTMASATALAQFVFVAAAFTALGACYVTSDFSVLNVYENSNSAMPLPSCRARFTPSCNPRRCPRLTWSAFRTAPPP